MFDVGASELLLIVIVAVVVIGPKDMPLAMRTAGRWIGKMRKISGHFRAGIDAMVREAELEEMERKWREQNEAIMKANPVLPSAEEMLPPASRVTPADILSEDTPQHQHEPNSLPAPEAGPHAEAPAVEHAGERRDEFHIPPPPP
jgi:sec-independent protein translocase protein TatB